MPRVHFVKKARKTKKAFGIKKGQSYYWWAFRYGGKRVSKTYPRPSQLTQSEYFSTAYQLQEQIEDLKIEGEEQEDIANELRSVADELRSLGQETSDKVSNMPEQLQDSDIGQMLEERGECCETTADELDYAADEIETLESEDKVQDIKNIIDGINWDFGN